MNTQAQSLLKTFDDLPDSAKQEVIVEILRRTKDMPVPSLTDDELVASAENLFLELDQREMNDEHPTT